MPELPEELPTQPKRFSGDTGSAEQHPLPDVIEFDRYQSSKEAAKNAGSPFAGVRIGQVSQPPTA